MTVEEARQAVLSASSTLESCAAKLSYQQPLALAHEELMHIRRKIAQVLANLEDVGMILKEGEVRASEEKNKKQCIDWDDEEEEEEF